MIPKEKPLLESCIQAYLTTWPSLIMYNMGLTHSLVLRYTTLKPGRRIRDIKIQHDIYTFHPTWSNMLEVFLLQLILCKYTQGKTKPPVVVLQHSLLFNHPAIFNDIQYETKLTLWFFHHTTTLGTRKNAIPESTWRIRISSNLAYNTKRNFF